MALTDKLGNIADAIRDKTGSTDSLTLDAMPEAIRSIETGGSSPTLATSIVDRTVTAITAEDLAGITKIGDHAFYKCTYLTTVALGNNISSIDDYAFGGCTKLKTVTLSEGLTTIDLGAFSNCARLQSISIPSTVTLIQSMAFNSCSALANIYYAGTEEQWAAISKGDSNTALTTATIHYNS